MGDPSARRRLSQSYRGCGFGGSITQAAGQNKQALGPDQAWGLLRICQRWLRGLSGSGNRSDIMSVVEQLDDGRGNPPPRRDPLMEAEAVIDAQLEQSSAR